MMTIQSGSASDLPLQHPTKRTNSTKRQKQPGNQSQKKKSKKPHIRSETSIKQKLTPIISGGSNIDSNQVALAELDHLRNSMQTMEERLKAVEIDRDEWKEKAKTLANNFLKTMKELKDSLYAVKHDQENELVEARAEFEQKILSLADQIGESRGPSRLTQGNQAESVSTVHLNQE